MIGASVPHAVYHWLLAMALVLIASCTPGGDSPEQVADEFFAAAVEQDIVAAYALLSNSYQHQLTPAQLQQFLIESGSETFTAVSWQRRDDGSTANGARLLGAISTQGEQVEHVELIMLNGPQGWRVVAINIDPLGERQQSALELPSAQQQAQLASTNMNLFWQGLESGSLSAFYQQVSATWREQLSLEQLESAFADLLGADIDWNQVAKVEPVLVPATAVGPQGKLVLGGVYPAG